MITAKDTKATEDILNGNLLAGHRTEEVHGGQFLPQGIPRPPANYFSARNNSLTIAA